MLHASDAAAGLARLPRFAPRSPLVAMHALALRLALRARAAPRAPLTLLVRALHATAAAQQREVKTKAAKKPAAPAAAAAPPAGDEDEGDEGGADAGKDLPSVLARHVAYARRELGKLRGAAVSPALLDGVLVDAYGERAPLADVAQVALKGAGALVVHPFDTALVGAVVDAIRDAELGVTPTADGDLVRVAVPKPSKETREAAVKLVSKIAEAAKTRVRRARGAALDKVKKAGLPPDDAARETKAVEETVAAAAADVAKLADAKRGEIERGA